MAVTIHLPSHRVGRPRNGIRFPSRLTDLRSIVTWISLISYRPAPPGSESSSGPRKRHLPAALLAPERDRDLGVADLGVDQEARAAGPSGRRSYRCRARRCRPLRRPTGPCPCSDRRDRGRTSATPVPSPTSEPSGQTPSPARARRSRRRPGTRLKRNFAPPACTTTSARRRAGFRRSCRRRSRTSAQSGRGLLLRLAGLRPGRSRP